MPRVLPLILLCAAAHAAEVAQFRAEDFGAEWRAARDGAALAAVHPATNGWTTAFADRGGVSFSATNGVASPLEFDPATTSAVARVLIVADCTKGRVFGFCSRPERRTTKVHTMLGECQVAQDLTATQMSYLSFKPFRWTAIPPWLRRPIMHHTI